MLFVLIATLFCTIIPYLAKNVNVFLSPPEIAVSRSHFKGGAPRNS